MEHLKINILLQNQKQTQNIKENDFKNIKAIWLICNLVALKIIFDNVNNTKQIFKATKLNGQQLKSSDPDYPSQSRN